MSKPMIRSKPASRDTSTAPTTPPAGPDRIASLPWKRCASVSPPFDLHELQPRRRRRRRAAGESRSTCRRSGAGSATGRRRRPWCRRARRASSAGSPRATTETCVKPSARASAASARSCCGIAVAVQQHDRHRADAVGARRARGRAAPPRGRAAARRRRARRCARRPRSRARRAATAARSGARRASAGSGSRCAARRRSRG